MRSFQEIHHAALQHMEAGTTDIGEVSANPVESYLQKSTFDLEMNHTIRKRPLPLVPTAKLAVPGDYFATEVAGIPVVAVRDEDHKVKVLINVCRHRGAQIVKSGSGRGLKEFVCPFHGWMYRQSGELFKVPEVKKCFAKSHLGGHGLVELKSTEFAGFVWVLLDNNADFELEKALSLISSDFLELKVEPKFSLEEFTAIGSFNWKLGVEAFLEVDHFPFAHAPYLANLEFPSLSLGDSVDDENHRIVVPLKKPAAGESILSWAQVMYFIFPSSFLLLYSDHVAFINLTPIDVDRTLFKYIPLVPRKSDLVSSQIQKKVELLKVIIQQDLDILEGIQKGLNSGANSKLLFTRTEHVLTRFHESLKRFRGELIS